MKTIVEITMITAKISWVDQAPSSLYILLALSLSPGISNFSGLQVIIKNPQRRKVIIQPMGAM